MEFMFLPFKRYFEVSGRSRRKEYWRYNLLVAIISIIAEIVANTSNLFLILIWTLLTLATIIPSITVRIRRLHDVGKSGWFMFIPIYGEILLFFNSEQGLNQYGPNPKEND